MSSQQESSTASSQQAHYASGARSRTSFLRFHESLVRPQFPSISLFSVVSSPYRSEGPVGPTPRPPAGGPRSPLPSSTSLPHSKSVSLPPGNQDYARNMLQQLAVVVSATDTKSFEIFGNFYLYTKVYHEGGVEWWQGTIGYTAYTAKYADKENIRWNSDLRGTEMWKYFQQCVDRLGSAVGTPRVMCIMCRKVLAHRSGTGTSSIHDHNRSSACLKSGKINGFDAWGGTPCATDIPTPWHKGTKTGNKGKIINLATPAGFNQHNFKEYFLKAFLATNLPFNCSNNSAFCRMFKYIRTGIEIPSRTTLTRPLKLLGNSTVEDIRTGLPTEGRISLAADNWTSPKKIAFLAIVAYRILDSWQMEEVLIGFEEMKGSHTGVNMAGIINEVLARYGIQHRILGFTTNSASNNRRLTETLNHAWSLLAVEWSQLENHIPCMAHVVQLILTAFISSIKVK